MANAAVYTRISKDSYGDALGVARQEAACLELCERRGWTPTVYCDNDRSAFDPRKVRPAYTAMLNAVKAGEITVIVAWHPDRLTRQTRELVPFIDLVNSRAVHVETVTAGLYDLGSASGRMQSRMLGAVAEYESEHKSERIRAKLAANAAAGKHHGGARPYGYNDDRVTVREDEAAVVREATDRVLAGESLKSILRDLNARELWTATGRPWRDVTLRGVLARSRNAALRTYHGEIVGLAAWDPILPADEFHSLVAALNAPGRRTNPGRGGRVHLLSGVAMCGVCGDVCRAGKGKANRGASRTIYRCATRSCVTRDQERLDDLVTRLVLVRLARPDAAALLLDEDDDDSRQAAGLVEVLHNRITDAAEAYAAGKVTLGQLTTITATVEPQLTAAQLRAVTPTRARVLAGVVGVADVERAWAAVAPSRRRAIVNLLMTVRVLPTKHGRGFNVRDIVVEWKGTGPV